MNVHTKICGINDAASMQAAIDGGTKYVGLVFFPRSPRYVTQPQAKELAKLVPPNVTLVGLFVDPVDDLLKLKLADVPLNIIQLHGSETPQRVAAIKALTGLKVMKAIPVASAEDVALAASYEGVADYILFDAKAPAGAELPGGNAKSFDWHLLQGITLTKPWLLAGGLNAKNIAEAVKVSGAKIVDVSSGVEDAPGHKSPAKIGQFLTLAATL